MAKFVVVRGLRINVSNLCSYSLCRKEEYDDDPSWAIEITLVGGMTQYVELEDEALARGTLSILDAALMGE